MAKAPVNIHQSAVQAAPGSPADEQVVLQRVALKIFKGYPVTRETRAEFLLNREYLRP